MINIMLLISLKEVLLHFLIHFISSLWQDSRISHCGEYSDKWHFNPNVQYYRHGSAATSNIMDNQAITKLTYAVLLLMSFPMTYLKFLLQRGHITHILRMIMKRKSTPRQQS